MNEIILCALFGIFILISFIIGLSFGCKLRNNETIKIPNLNPVKAIKDYKEDKKQKEREDKEQEILEQNLANIEAYDGTEFGQKDFEN